MRERECVCVCACVCSEYSHSQLSGIGSDVQESPVGVKGHTGGPQGEAMETVL